MTLKDAIKFYASRVKKSGDLGRTVFRVEKRHKFEMTGYIAEDIVTFCPWQTGCDLVAHILDVYGDLDVVATHLRERGGSQEFSFTIRWTDYDKKRHGFIGSIKDKPTYSVYDKDESFGITLHSTGVFPELPAVKILYYKDYPDRDELFRIVKSLTGEELY